LRTVCTKITDLNNYLLPFYCPIFGEHFSFHEEGGRYGKGEDGKYHVVNAKPGAKTDPLTEGMATVDVGKGNAVSNSPLIESEGSFHVHPRGTRSPGTNTIGGQSGSFVQSPTPGVDYGVAGNYPGKSYVQ
jgi:hypothetical protein